jgi:ketosteroid isomerase-like protein
MHAVLFQIKHICRAGSTAEAALWEAIVKTVGKSTVKLDQARTRMAAGAAALLPAAALRSSSKDSSKADSKAGLGL